MERIKYDIAVKEVFSDKEVDHSLYKDSFADALTWAESAMSVLRMRHPNNCYQAMVTAICFSGNAVMWEALATIGTSREGALGTMWMHTMAKKEKAA